MKFQSTLLRLTCKLSATRCVNNGRSGFAAMAWYLHAVGWDRAYKGP